MYWFKKKTSSFKARHLVIASVSPKTSCFQTFSGGGTMSKETTCTKSIHECCSKELLHPKHRASKYLPFSGALNCQPLTSGSASRFKPFSLQFRFIETPYICPPAQHHVPPRFPLSVVQRSPNHQSPHSVSAPHIGTYVC